MSRTSVRKYVVDILSAAIHDIKIEAAFPKAEGITDLIFVQAITEIETRATMPRGGGRKNVNYNITMMVMTSADDESLVPAQMDKMLEEIFTVLRTTPLNVVITDPDTHQNGSLVSVAETIRVLTDNVFQLMSTQGNEAEVMESVGFTFDLCEQIQA